MDCGGCGHGNRDGRKFCATCGAALATVCGRCGYGNLADERFCGGCGARLDAPTPIGERRPVAILFADLTGFTRLSTTLDPEELHQLLTGFFAAVDGVCIRYGGRIDKHIGDNVMAIFGAPVAHGDDPERACRAAVEIHREVAAYAERIGRPLAVHVGIAYGEVIASGLGSAEHAEYTVLGDAVNLAARLQDKAIGGETMISDALYRAARRIAIVEPAGEVPVKGLAEPVVVWKLRDIERAQVTASAPARLVGRDRELAQIESRLVRVATERTGVLIVLRGEAGIGKSTVAAEAARRATVHGFAVHIAQVLDYGQGRGAGAIATLVAGLLGAGANDDERRRALDTAVATGAVTATDRDHLASLLELAPGESDTMLDDRDRGSQQDLSLAQLVASRAVPPVLVVEDVHWADSATRARLLAAIGAATARDGAILVTTRIDGDPVDDAWRSAGKDVLALELAPLQDDAARALAASQLTDPDLAARCVQRAGGNPLYLEQLLHAAGDHGALPGTLQALVLSRVDRLPARDKAALQAAAVAGQRFSLELVRHLAGDRGWQPD
jgi:class 3 adenylate cyclase